MFGIPAAWASAVLDEVNSLEDAVQLLLDDPGAAERIGLEQDDSGGSDDNHSDVYVSGDDDEGDDEDEDEDEDGKIGDDDDAGTGSDGDYDDETGRRRVHAPSYQAAVNLGMTLRVRTTVVV